MIVEFVGPPGVGKTTIAQHLGEITGWQVISVTGYETSEGHPLAGQRLARQRLWSLASQPGLLGAALVGAVREGRGEATSWMINLARRNSLVKRLEAPNVILEEGPLSGLCLAMAARNGYWDGSSMVPRLRTGEAVVVVEAQEETILRRLVERGGILSDRPPTELRHLTRRYLNALDSVLPLLPASQIRVTSEGDPNVIAGTLRNWLLS